MFDRIISFNNLLSAYYKARRHKRFQKPLQIFEFNLEKNLINLQTNLATNQYRPRKYHRFITYEPKKRQISAPAFIDRILHHAIITIIEPIFEDVFINHSFACRRGKGTHFGMLQVSRAYHQFNQHTPASTALNATSKATLPVLITRSSFVCYQNTSPAPKPSNYSPLSSPAITIHPTVAFPSAILPHNYSPISTSTLSIYTLPKLLKSKTTFVTWMTFLSSLPTKNISSTSVVKSTPF